MSRLCSPTLPHTSLPKKVSETWDSDVGGLRVGLMKAHGSFSLIIMFCMYGCVCKAMLEFYSERVFFAGGSSVERKHTCQSC